MLYKESEFEQRIRESDDSIKTCIKYVCAANHIDFSAVENVDEQTCEKLLEKTGRELIQEDEYLNFRNDLEKAKN